MHQQSAEDSFTNNKLQTVYMNTSTSVHIHVFVHASLISLRQTEKGREATGDRSVRKKRR